MSASSKPPADRLDRISRVNALRAAAAGGEAFRAGACPSACPYCRETQTDRFLAYYWLAGWRAAGGVDA